MRSEFQQEALPDAPEIPGYHTCWLSTTSSYDPIHKRLRMGYEPVTPQDAPGLDTFRMKAAGTDGLITCNEMALYKIPNARYLEYMTVFHHDMPLDSEEAILSNLRQGHKDSTGRALEEVEGYEDLAVDKPPQFAL